MKWWLAGFAVLLAHGQQELPPETLLLAKIKAKVSENLKRLPNYTCTEIIERWHRPTPSDRPRMLDTVRLEVAYVEGKELFGWPGAGRIDQSEIGKLVGGTTGNGDFALIVKGIFLGPSATFHYEGDTELDGRKALSFDYHVAQLMSGYRIRTPGGQAFVGHHGSFWVDTETLDLMRLEVSAEEIPLTLRVESAAEAMEYGRVAIGHSTFLLPKSSELILTDLTGAEHRNRTRFEACRQFVSESVVSFTEAPPEPASVQAKPPVKEAKLPDDFTVDISLETAIDSASSAVGDPVRAVLRQSIKPDRESLVPKGAVLSGRIATLESLGGFITVKLAFTSLDFEGGHAELDGRSSEVFRMVSTKSSNARFNGRAIDSAVLTRTPLVFEGTRLKLSRGMHLILRSRLVKSEHHDPIRP